jgi:hypothetical protein
LNFEVKNKAAIAVTMAGIQIFAPLNILFRRR